MKYFIIFYFIFYNVNCQSLEVDSIFHGKVREDCGIIRPRKKLKGRRYITTPVMYLRSGNSEYTYALLHLGKRGRQLFVYINVIDPVVCFKEGKILDIHLTNGKIISLKNKYPVNCEGVFVKRIKRRMRKKILRKKIAYIKLYSYGKNYKFFLSDIQNVQLKKNIMCLQKYRY